ncbi:MAG: VWA domain-containing protein [Haloarculaceae archaeon]
MKVTTEVNRPYVPASGTTVAARVDVDPGEWDRSQGVQRHVALCIDTSGSMEGEKIQRARDGASWVFGLLDPDDYVSIVAFDSNVDVVLHPTRWGDTTREEAMARVDDLDAGGKTDMYAGLQAAKRALAGLEGDDTVRRLLLLSDGRDSNREPIDFERLAEDVDDAGIRIESAGIGTDYNAETIRTLGTTARGEWTHLERPGDIEEFFGAAVERAESVVAPDARLELDLAPGVSVSDVFRSLPQAQAVDLAWDGGTAVVKLPDLVDRERQVVVMRVSVPEATVDGEREQTLATVHLRTRDGRVSEDLTVTYTDDNGKLARNNEDVAIDHRRTMVRTELGRGNVEAAETEIERMTEIHGAETDVVQEVQRQTELVKEGGRAERSQATKIVDDEGVQ